MLHADLPPGICLDDAVRLCVEADLRPDGSFGKEWLALAGNHLYVFSQHDGAATERLKLPFGELRDLKPELLVGGAVLEASHLGNPVEIIRYSNGRAADFATAIGVMGKWLDGEDTEVPEDETKRCGTCGLPLPPGTKVCPACVPKGRTLMRLFTYLRPFMGTAVMLAILASVNTGLGLVQPYLFRPLIDDVLAPTGVARANHERIAMLGVLVVILVASHVLRAVIGTLQSWMSSRLGNDTTHSIRSQLYQHLQYLSLRFFDKRQMGSVISRVNQDTGQLQGFLVWGAQDLVTNFLQVVGIGVVLFVLNWKMALIVFIPAPVVAVMSSILWPRMRQVIHHFFRRWGRVNAILSETLNGLRIVRAFAQEPREIGRFARQSKELADAGTNLEFTWSVVFSSFTLLIMLGTFITYYIGGLRTITGEMSTGTFMAFLAYVGLFYQPVQALSMILNWCSRSLTATERVFEVLDSDPEVKEDDDAARMPRIEGRVEFRNVHFGYERHKMILKKLSFVTEPGEMIGLVGHSGAGKSTTINLLCRFYDTTEGEILIDGVPIQKIHVPDLRSQIGLVPQDTFLFSGTIMQNIAYAKPDATPADIIRAAKVANAHEFIMQKPDGYETYIGEGGRGLSGGEMQRISIARAVLHNPRILILDEATSSVDVETEGKIQEAIGRLVKGRTTFAIAHRLSTLKNANRLIVLKDGEITEIGTHDELLSKEEGEFARQVKAYQEISKVHAVAR